MSRPIAHRPLWQSVSPSSSYDVVVVGAGGHGLATAHALASRCGITNVAVIERDWLGGGNTARNATIIRANYLRVDDRLLHLDALAAWETLDDELEYATRFKRCGLVSLAHDDIDLAEGWRLTNGVQHAGRGAHFISPENLGEFAPLVRVTEDGALPVRGAFWFEDAGSAKHDHVAWGYAAAAQRCGVDIIEGCEVRGFIRRGDRVVGVDTALGRIASGTVVLCAASGTPALLSRLGVSLPLEIRPLQAYVTELLAPLGTPMLMSRAAQLFLSQADKGELVMGLPLDPRPAQHRRASLELLEEQIPRVTDLVPALRRAHLLRAWAGSVDLTPDGRPLIGIEPLSGVVVNCGWGTGGFKATPIVGRHLATAVVDGTVPAALAGYDLHRFDGQSAIPSTGMVAH